MASVGDWQLELESGSTSLVEGENQLPTAALWLTSTFVSSPNRKNCKMTNSCPRWCTFHNHSTWETEAGGLSRNPTLSTYSPCLSKAKSLKIRQTDGWKVSKPGVVVQHWKGKRRRIGGSKSFSAICQVWGQSSYETVSKEEEEGDREGEGEEEKKIGIGIVGSFWK